MSIEKILWGDDQKEFLTSMKSALEPKYKIDIALNPEEVIEKAEQKKYDLVITDLRYSEGGKEGFDVIKAVKDKVKYVILCSADAKNTQIQKTAKTAGAYDILQKPVFLLDLKEYLKGLK